jgi:hypothetical protein
MASSTAHWVTADQTEVDPPPASFPGVTNEVAHNLLTTNPPVDWHYALPLTEAELAAVLPLDERRRIWQKIMHHVNIVDWMTMATFELHFGPVEPCWWTLRLWMGFRLMLWHRLQRQYTACMPTDIMAYAVAILYLPPQFAHNHAMQPVWVTGAMPLGHPTLVWPVGPITRRSYNSWCLNEAVRATKPWKYIHESRFRFLRFVNAPLYPRCLPPVREASEAEEDEI